MIYHHRLKYIPYYTESSIFSTGKYTSGHAPIFVQLKHTMYKNRCSNLTYFRCTNY